MENKKAALNPTSDFGITSDSELIAEHKFTWKIQEFIMIGSMLFFGLFIAIFVKPELLGIMFIVGAIGMAALNGAKKKKSLLQLYQTPHGLKLYHLGVLIEEASDPKLTLKDIREVLLVRSGSKEIIVMKGWNEDPIVGHPYMKVPFRMIKSEAFAQILKDWYKTSHVKFSKDIAQEVKYLTKYEKAK